MLKIAFLFLAYNGIHHENYWQSFLNGHESAYSMYIHSKNGIPAESAFKKYELAQKIPTTWANTMRAQIELLRVALQDPLNEKFIFVSETTLPLTDFKTTYKTFFATDKSIFSYGKSPYDNPKHFLYRRRSLKNIPQEFRYLNSQWVIINRKHATAMVNDKFYLDRITQYEADNEFYPASFIASQRLLHEIEPRDLTYVKWPPYPSPSPLTFSKFDNGFDRECILKAIADGFLFARKIAATADLSPLDPYLAYRQQKN